MCQISELVSLVTCDCIFLKKIESGESSACIERLLFASNFILLTEFVTLIVLLVLSSSFKNTCTVKFGVNAHPWGKRPSRGKCPAPLHPKSCERLLLFWSKCSPLHSLRLTKKHDVRHLFACFTAKSTWKSLYLTGVSAHLTVFLPCTIPPATDSTAWHLYMCTGRAQLCVTCLVN